MSVAFLLQLKFCCCANHGGERDGRKCTLLPTTTETKIKLYFRNFCIPLPGVRIIYEVIVVELLRRLKIWCKMTGANNIYCNLSSNSLKNSDTEHEGWFQVSNDTNITLAVMITMLCDVDSASEGATKWSLARIGWLIMWLQALTSEG